MTRHSRYRTSTSSWSGRWRATKFRLPNGNWQTATINKSRTCSDSVGQPVVDSGFDSLQPATTGRMNGIATSTYAYSTLGSGREYDDYPLAVFVPPSLDVTPIVAPSGWYLSLVAATNPSRPVVTPLTLLQDLIDLPAMLRDIPRLMKSPQRVLTAKGASDTYLGTIFGWMPFVEDIHQLLNLQSAIAKRSEELQRLYSGQGLKRRVLMGESTEVEPSSSKFSLMGPNNYFTVPSSVTVRKRAWATIHWYPTTLPPYHPDDMKWNQHIRRIVLGMTTEGTAKGLWDIIPWTWLVGWFTNIGKYALAYSNTVPASHSGACFMSKVEVFTTFGSVTSVGCHDCNIVATGESTYTHRTRTVSGALTPGFNVPFLSTSRLSILGALTVQRILR